MQQSDKIAIIGANGYVGAHLLDKLAGKTNVFGIVHSPNSVFKKSEGVTYHPFNENYSGTFDIIINTAYAAGKSIDACIKQNQLMLQYIKKHAHPTTKIIHLSSLAVFGIAIDRTIIPEPIPDRMDEVYVYSKLHMENLLLQHIPSQQLQILRIGNVWGPGNTSWTQPLIDGILFELPIRFEGQTFSNTTYIHNLTDYITHLINHDERRLIHHVAELSHISWQEWIEPLEHLLQSKANVFNQKPEYPSTLLQQLRLADKSNPRAFLKSLKNGRFTSYYFSRLVEVLGAYRGKKSYHIPFYSTDHFIQQDAQSVWSCTTEFKSVLVNNWTPPFGKEAVLEELKKWMKDSGYLIRAT